MHILKHNYFKMKKISILTHRGGYISPMINVAEVAVEQGFAASGIGSAGWESGSADDDNTNDLGNF